MTVFVVLLSLIVSAGAANYGYSNDNVDNNPEGISTGSEPDNAATRGGEARYKPTISDTRVEYVIITASTFEDELAPLAEWNTRKGVAAKIYTLEDIYNDYTGVDKAQQVHNFLRDIDSKSNHLQWVLLAGDADADQNANDPPLPFVPSRYLYSHGATYGQSDYYWGDVYFAGLSHDWNQDSDDKWGEIDSNHFSLQGTGTSGEESKHMWAGCPGIQVHR